MRKINLIILLSFITNLAFGQTKKAYIEAADKAFENKNYYAALKYYDEALQFKSDDTLVLYKSAEAARMFDSYKIAAKKYTYLIDSLDYHGEPTMKYYLGELYQKMGDYPKARDYFNLYLAEHSGEDEEKTAIATKELEAVNWAAEQVVKTDELYKMDKFSGSVNTPYSEFGANTFGDTIYYSSMQFKEKNPKEYPPRQISRILKTDTSGSAPKVLSADWNNKDLPTAHNTFSKDGKKVYYTICDYTSSSTLRCDIYQSDIDSSGFFINSKKLDINQDSVTNTHPCIGIDAITGKEALYFASDREGTKGGLDIWYSVIDKNLGFSQPTNLESINTTRDDVTPFYHFPSNTLYFSSNGRRGFGGFDIYKKTLDADIDYDVEQLEAPINSSYHDLYFTADDALIKYLFSSNREGSFFVDNYYEACCFDIYTVDVLDIEINLLALIFDKTNLEALNGALVTITDEATGEELFRSYLEDSHEHKFRLQRGKNYIITATKDHYLPESIKLSTKDIFKSEDIVRKLYLDLDDIMLDVFTFDLETKEDLIGVTVELEEVGNPRNKVKLENLRSNFFTFVLDKGKEYKITATRPNYFPATEYVDTREMDKGGRIRKDLYLDKHALEKFLPVTLYFDNDVPDNRSKSTNTKRSYSELLDQYVRSKEEYKEIYTKPFNGVEKQAANDELETFFEGDVKGGYDMLRVFMDVLFKELNNGRAIELSIRGYASPRAETKYNLVLGQRRVNSIKNEMMTYRDGLLSQFLNNRQLIITDVSFGEELAPKTVEDNLANKRLSIYSPDASKQRKVEIVKVSKN